jgi:hypothetical protein
MNRLKKSGIHIHNGILFSLKKKGNPSHATAKMNLEDTMLNEIS